MWNYIQDATSKYQPVGNTAWKIACLFHNVNHKEIVKINKNVGVRLIKRSLKQIKRAF